MRDREGPEEEATKPRERDEKLETSGILHQNMKGLKVRNIKSY